LTPVRHEDEAVFTRESITKGDPPNDRRRRRRRKWWWSLLVKIEGDPLNTQHAQQEDARRGCLYS